ncbi:hypothetical protein [Corallococcus exercitus]|uniref:hypothetical protein n=1 Tax=Corallococcus exercitus TaxID=2316736 RepID=UPI0035D484F9
MPCIFCEIGICADPGHAGASNRGRLQPVKIFDIRRSIPSAPPVTPSFDPPRPSPIQPLNGQVQVREYRADEGGWNTGSQLVNDAKSLFRAWLHKAKQDRGENWRSPPLDNEDLCSGANWAPVDEGMDVTRQIVKVNTQHGRNEAGVTLWRAYGDGPFGPMVVGILIMQNAVSRDNDDGVEHELGIRWLVGHPTIRGVGAALMAKADALHQTAPYRRFPMHVTASRSSVTWYQRNGFTVVEPATCNDEDTSCGCSIMIKAAPPQ